MKAFILGDLHLSRTLYGKKRVNDSEAALKEVVRLAGEHRPELLLLTGDIYHTSWPSPGAQRMYMDFLSEIAGLVRHTVVIAGNHDSATLVDAGRRALLPLNVHVCATEEGFGGEGYPFVLDLPDVDCAICAAPFLPDSVVRQYSAGLEDRDAKWMEGMKKFYTEGLPFVQHRGTKIAMGHFTVQGAKLLDERPVGDAEVPLESFNGYDFVAMGHIHLPQILGDSIVYAGSPFAQTFEEAENGHSICLAAHMPGEAPSFTTLSMPEVVRLVTVESASPDEILDKVSALCAEGAPTWIKVRYTGQRRPSLRKELDEIIAGSSVEVLCIEVPSVGKAPIPGLREEEVLAEISPPEVFGRLLESRNVPGNEQLRLMRDFKKLCAKVENAGPADER